MAPKTIAIDKGKAVPISPMGIDGHSYRGGNGGKQENVIDVTTPPTNLSRPVAVPTNKTSTGTSEKMVDSLPQNIVDVERLLQEQSSPTASATSATRSTLTSPSSGGNNSNDNENENENDAGDGNGDGDDNQHRMNIHQQELELEALRLMYGEAKTKMVTMKHEKETNKKMLLEMSQLVKGLQTIALRSTSTSTSKSDDHEDDDEEDDRISSAVVQSQIQEIDRRMKEAQEECGILLEEKFEQSQKLEKQQARIKVMEGQILELVDQLEEQTDVKATSESDMKVVVAEQESQIRTLENQIESMKNETTTGFGIEEEQEDDDDEDVDIYDDDDDDDEGSNSTKSRSRDDIKSVDDILNEEEEEEDDDIDEDKEEIDENGDSKNDDGPNKDVGKLTQNAEELQKLVAKNAQKYTEINQLQSKLDALREKQRAHRAQFEGIGSNKKKEEEEEEEDSHKVEEIMHVEEEEDGGVTVRVYQRETSPPELPTLRTTLESSASVSSSDEKKILDEGNDQTKKTTRRFSSNGSRSSRSSTSSSSRHGLTVISEEGESAFNTSQDSSYDRSPAGAAGQIDSALLLSPSSAASSATSTSSSSASSTGWESSSGSSTSQIPGEEDEKEEELLSNLETNLQSQKEDVKAEDEKSSDEHSLEPSEDIVFERSEHSTGSTAVSYVETDDDGGDGQNGDKGIEVLVAEENVSRADDEINESLEDGDGDLFDESGVTKEEKKLVEDIIDEIIASEEAKADKIKDDKGHVISQHSKGKTMLQQELEEARSKLDKLCVEHRTDASVSNSKFAQLEEENKELRKSNMVALSSIAQVAEITARSESLKDENEELRKELEELKAEKQAMKNQLANADNEKAQSTDALEVMSRDHNMTVMKLADLSEDNAALEKELSATKAQLQKAFADLQGHDELLEMNERLRTEYEELVEEHETTKIFVERQTEKYTKLKLLHEQTIDGKLPKDSQKLQLAYSQALSRIEYLERANDESGDASAKLGASELKLTMKDDEMKKILEKNKSTEKKLAESQSCLKNLIVQYKKLEKEKAQTIAKLEKAEALHSDSLQTTSRVAANDNIVEELKATLLASKEQIMQLEKERDEAIERAESSETGVAKSKKDIRVALEGKNARENDMRIVMEHHKKLLSKYNEVDTQLKELLPKYSEAKKKISDLEKFSERIRETTNHTRTTTASMSVGPNTEPVLSTLDYLYEEEKKEDDEGQSVPVQQPRTVDEASAKVVQSKLTMDDDDDPSLIKNALTQETIEEVIVDEDGNEFIEEVISPTEYEEIEVVDDNNVNSTQLLRQSEAKVATLTKELRSARDQVVSLQAEKKQIKGELSEVKTQLMLAKRRATFSPSPKWGAAQKKDTVAKINDDEDSMGFSENSVGFAQPPTATKTDTKVEAGSLKSVARDDASSAQYHRLQKLYDSLQARYNKLEQDFSAAKKELKERADETKAARSRANKIQSHHDSLQEEHNSVLQRLDETKKQLELLKK
mmetsp:Transcript_14559/g.35367  ORF Transcript_14559/g.35367 Transcript_14559/m.35367 type:complete len:1491 (+) Transcript_14559:147-4619(+)